MQSLINSLKIQLLIFGYIRLNYDKYVPPEIIKICNGYFQRQIKWTIPINEIQTVNDDILLGPIFEIEHTTFQCQLNNPYDNALNIQIVLKSLPDKIKNNIKSILIYYQIYCDDTKTVEKDKAVLSKIGNFIKWRYEEYDEYEHKESISFDIYMDILALKLNDNKHLNTDYMHKSIVMRKQIHYDWIIDKRLLDIFINCNSKKGKMFYSPNFGWDGTEVNGDNFAWTLYCRPNGSRYNQTYVQLGLLLLNLPSKIGYIHCNVTFKTDYKNVAYSKSQSFHIYEWINFVRTVSGRFKLQPSDLKEVCIASLTFSVDIEIESVYDLNDKQLNTAKWNQYGLQ